MKHVKANPGTHNGIDDAVDADSWAPVIFERLLAAMGPQHWWPVTARRTLSPGDHSSAHPGAGRANRQSRPAPADPDTEIVIGAILTQNTAWTNVEQAIDNLAEANALSWTALRGLSRSELAALIRPSGTYRVKAKRLKAFVDFLWDHHGGELKFLLSGDLETARARLLLIHGIGPETADAILLYVGGFPTFVVDAYTKRVLRRHFFIDGHASYEDVRMLFQNSEFQFQNSETPSRNSQTVAVFKEYHALFVALGKRHCRTRANCDGCPLADLPHDESK